MSREPITEEPLDLYLNRPLAKGIVSLLDPTPVTANQVTVCAGLVGILSGGAMALATPAAVGTAAALLWLFLILDCADGELARRRGGGSRLGRILDGSSDYVAAIAMHVGLWLLAVQTPAFGTVPPWLLFGIVLLTGVCKAVHSALYDAAKQRFRMGLGHAAGGLESVEEIRTVHAQATLVSERLFLRIYLTYLRMQRLSGGVTPAHQALSQAEFLAWTVLGPTTRTTVVAATLVASLGEPRALVAYPLFGVGFANVWLGILLIWRRLSSRHPVRAAEPGPAPP